MDKINLFILLLAITLSEGYKPVFIIHGLFENSTSLQDLVSFIQQSHPGTIIKVPDIYTNAKSLEELWSQTKAFGKLVQEFSSEHKDGFHLIGFSQGGVIARAVLQTTPDLNIDSFIALSTPINGQFGANYWRDPQKRHLYRKFSSVLAPLNNQSLTPNIYSWQWRDNFLRIQNLVLIGGPQDGVITPWQSALMGYYDRNLNVLDMEQLEEYQKDSFGLKTLNEAGRIHKYIFPGVRHTFWYKNQEVFTRAIEPYLV